MANDMNVVTLTGRVTQDAKSREYNDITFYDFTIAVNRRVKKGEEWTDVASFIDITYSTKYGKIGQYMKKGQFVGITGSLKQERWEKDGQKYSKVVVNADDILLLGGGNTTEKEERANAKVAKATTPEDFSDDFDDVVPF